jgi:formate-dependent nitrite reductase cytochrome c552 subunit
MKWHCKERKLALLAAFTLCAVIAVVNSAAPKAPHAAAPQSEGKFWRPRRTPAGTEFVGHQVCATCHVNLVRVQQQSSMGRALERVAETRILAAYPRLQFRFGKYFWEITRQGDQNLYSVTDGKEVIVARVAYVFGQGKSGQTYVLEYKGSFYESRLSFYNEIQGLDFTLGHPRTEPNSLVAALGKLMPQDETLECFSCHATGAVIGTELHLDRMIPGVSCEACHGPGGDHVAAGKAGLPNKDRIFNPARLNADDMAQEFCGACHRSAGDIFARPNLDGINNVRFQPYRIFSSKCYSDDRRISCTACHNPHESVKQEMAYYDAKCLACHQAKGEPLKADRQAPACRAKEKQSCAACHMPKVELPGAHFKFTDHRIRIARAGEPYPL